MRGAPLKRPQQPGLRQPAACRAACRPSVQCVSHIAGLESLCIGALHLQAAPDVRRAATWAARRTANERPAWHRRPRLSVQTDAPLVPLKRPARRPTRAPQPHPKPLFRQAAACWVSRSSCSVQPGALLPHAQQCAPLAAARGGRCGRQEPANVRRRAAESEMSRLLSLHNRLLLTTCLAHESATSPLNNTLSMHSQHMHTLLSNIGCRPALCTRDQESSMLLDPATASSSQPAQTKPGARQATAYTRS